MSPRRCYAWSLLFVLKKSNCSKTAQQSAEPSTFPPIFALKSGENVDADARTRVPIAGAEHVCSSLLRVAEEGVQYVPLLAVEQRGRLRRCRICLLLSGGISRAPEILILTVRAMPRLRTGCTSSDLVCVRAEILRRSVSAAFCTRACASNGAGGGSSSSFGVMANIFMFVLSCTEQQVWFPGMFFE